MKKSILLSLCITMAVVALINFSSANSEVNGNLEMRIPIGIIELKAPLEVTPKMSTVKFPHSKHFDDVTCNECHHTWEAIKGCMSLGCHDSVTSVKEDKDSYETYYYKKAYHKQCIGCHKKIKKQSKDEEFSAKVIESKISPSGPTGCTECHSE